MRLIFFRLILLCLLSWGGIVWSQGSRIESLRIWTAPDRTRLVFDVTAPQQQQHRIFFLKNPLRLVIDLSNTVSIAEIPKVSLDHPIFRSIRSGTRNKTDLRVVLDLKTPVKPKSFQLKPNQSYGDRLVVDLYPRSASARNNHTATKKLVVKAIEARDLVIAIDAGHGGEDPGAIGARGTREKDVVLTLAQQLAKLINNEAGMRAVLVRKGDYYLGLRERVDKARKAKADLFVSIHADAFKNSRVKGASIFTLSKRGASSEAARWLAAKENAADLIGGVKLGDKDNVLAKVLIDLSQTATMDVSYQVAKRVLRNLKILGTVHKNNVQRARFVVLKSPDIPSILVETAFISNRSEERKLGNPLYQQRLTKAIHDGIREYFMNNAPAGTRLALRKHVIRKGETLSGIAERYGVSMEKLRSINEINHYRIQVGQILTIPTDT